MVNSGNVSIKISNAVTPSHAGISRGHAGGRNDISRTCSTVAQNTEQTKLGKRKA